MSQFLAKFINLRLKVSFFLVIAITWLFWINKETNAIVVIYQTEIQSKVLSIYVIEMSIIKCEKVFAAIFIFSSLFKIKI